MGVFFRSSHRRYSVKKLFLHRKTSVLESFFNEVAGLQASNSIKKPPTHVFSCEYCKMLCIYYRTPLDDCSSFVYSPDLYYLSFNISLKFLSLSFLTISDFLRLFFQLGIWKELVNQICPLKQLLENNVFIT